MLVNVKLDVSWQTSLIFLILDDTVKTNWQYWHACIVERS